MDPRGTKKEGRRLEVVVECMVMTGPTPTRRFATHFLLSGWLTLVACGARTELDPFAPDGSVADATLPDGAVLVPGTTVGRFSGSTASGTTWLRPFTCADVGIDNHGYDAVTFDNPTRSDLRVEILVDWDFDGFLHAYENPFDPLQPGVGCIEANDDYTSTARSRLTGVFVPAGGSVDLVFSSWSAGSTGTYDAVVIVE